MATVDFSLAADGAHPDFTYVSDGDLLVFSGEWRVHAGPTPGADAVDWYWGRYYYEIPDGDLVQAMEVEFRFPTAGSLKLYCHSNTAMSSLNGAELGSDGFWISVYDGGGDGPNGNFGSLIGASWHTLKVAFPTSNTITITIDGTAVATGASISNPRTGLYGSLLVGQDCRVRKFGFPNGIEGGGPGPTAASRGRRRPPALTYR